MAKTQRHGTAEAQLRVVIKHYLRYNGVSFEKESRTAKLVQLCRRELVYGGDNQLSEVFDDTATPRISEWLALGRKYGLSFSCKPLQGAGWQMGVRIVLTTMECEKRWARRRIKREES